MRALAKTTDLWLFGSGGHARVVIATARAAGLRVAGLVDAPSADAPNEVSGVAVHRSQEIVPAGAPCIVAIGNPHVRQRIVSQFTTGRWATLVHPNADVARDAVMGGGTVVLSRAVVQPGSAIGRHTIINTGAIVEHDNKIGDYVLLATGACMTGAVTVGAGSLIGAGAVILPGIKVGNWCTVGAGAVVTHDVPDGVTVVGNPARPMYHGSSYVPPERAKPQTAG